MVKGVSQKVIEVVRTDNRYFEKAILFLRPNAPEQDKGKLKEHAWDYLGQIDYAPKKEEHGSFPDVLKIIAGALLGAGLACMFFLFY